MKGLLKVTTVLLASLVLLMGCQQAPAAAPAAKTEPAKAATPAPKAGQPKQGGQMVVATAEEEITLDFHQSNFTIGRVMIMNISDALVFQDDSTELKPGLAESWKQEDPTTWVFQLRKGVKFHDGTPFNAAAVKTNLDRLVNPDTKSPRRNLFDMIKAVEAPDENTVRVRLAYPYQPLLANLAMSNAHMMSPAALEKYGKDVGRNPVGTGPFVFKDWVSGDRITLEANKDYWRGRPNLDSLVFKFGTDSPTRVNLLKTGQVHIGMQLSSTDAKSVEGDQNLAVVPLAWPSIIGLGKNNQRKPFDDVRVRQAVSHAIDTDAIVKNVMLGAGKPQSTILTPGVFGYNPNLPVYKYDPNRAKQLLTEAGYPNGFDADFYFDSAVAQYRQIMEAVQGYLSAVGIKVRLEALDSTGLEAKRRSGEFFFIREGWGSITGDADFFLVPKLHTASIPPGGANFSRYSNKEVDALLDAARQEADRAKREKMYQDAEAIVYKDQPWTVLTQTIDVQGRSKRVRDVLFTTGFVLGFHKAWLD
ncbi:MAG: hypothetical protein HY675_13050 [Chloroflexi bacterium]|nr:hypothetical protein [Chloroflexota bacterium]